MHMEAFAALICLMYFPSLNKATQSTEVNTSSPLVDSCKASVFILKSFIVCIFLMY